MHELLERIARARILVVGDLMLDHYVWGDATRLSPEAPVPIVRVARDSWVAGGAANVAANLRALGATVELAGVVGADAAADELLEALARQGVFFDPSTLRQEACPTIVKTRVMCRNQQLCRLDREASPEAYRLSAAACEALAAQMARADAALISDYAKGVVTSDLVRRLQDLARPGQCLTLDPKPRPDFACSGLSLMTPNLAEAFALAGLSEAAPHGDPAALQRAAASIQARFQPEALVITLGGDGMRLWSQGRPGPHLQTCAREVFDVSGAGDTVIATLTAALAVGAPIEQAATLANLAAGVVVGKLGTAVATPDEILAHDAVNA